MLMRNLTASILLLTACWPSATPPSRQHGGAASREPRAELTVPAVVERDPGVAAQEPEAPAAEPEDVVVVEDEVGSGSWRTTAFVTVRAEPSASAVELGTIAPGSRLPRRTLTKDRACPQGWLEVDPRGFVCGGVVADRRQPDDALLPSVPRGAVIPGVYAKVRGPKTLLFDSVDAVRNGQGRLSEASLTVRRLGTVKVDGKSFWRTRHGLVAASRVRPYKGSRFRGVELDSDAVLPVAWTLRGEERFSVPLRAEPSPGLAEGERWIDIDLDEQTLVAYEGTTAVYATLVSSGKVLHRTPTGVYRIERKVAERTMNSMLDSSEEYTVDKVPWTAYFAHGYALHAAYWHSGFGQTRSHGCINLSPIDARRLYAWTAPAVAPGWIESYGHVDQPGSVVRVRNAKDPDPAWKGYAAALRESTKAG
jgi:hypothetical protein